MIILDTNVLSELMKLKPAVRVENWIAAQPSASLFITTLTQAEILYGVELLPKGKRRKALDKAVSGLFDEDFANRILPFDEAAAYAYAIVAAQRQLTGKPIAQFDAQIAAIARSRGATVATRNTSDFVDCGIHLVNPWDTQTS